MVHRLCCQTAAVALVLAGLRPALGAEAPPTEERVPEERVLPASPVGGASAPRGCESSQNPFAPKSDGRATSPNGGGDQYCFGLITREGETSDTRHRS